VDLGELIKSLLGLVKVHRELLFSLVTSHFVLLNLNLKLSNLTVAFKNGVFLLLYKTVKIANLLFKFSDGFFVGF